MTVNALVLYSPINGEYDFVDCFKVKYNHNVVNSCKYWYKHQVIQQLANKGVSVNKIQVIKEEYVAD